VQLVYEQDDVLLLVLELLEHLLHPLLEVPAEAGARHQPAHVERQHALAFQDLRDVLGDYALREPFWTVDDIVNGRPVKEVAKWVDWNDFNGELGFATGFRAELVKNGFPANIGMLIDTSRNGWGGPNRPTAKSTSTNPDTYVNESRIDRRLQKGNWCNQAGAGLGERPKAAPEPNIDAYVWIKPPGESDGASREIPNDEGKGFDRMCDPTYTGNPRNGNNLSGALPDAPLSGHWFSAQFQELMRNAYPAL
jgi:cellulose 1,4-beta-cellobiosidase